MTKPGAELLSDGTCHFYVWAPQRERMELKLIHPKEATYPMEKNPNGYWTLTLKDVSPDTQYFFRIDGTMDRPDPASRLQPRGVHEASQVVNQSSFPWTDQAWKNLDFSSLVFYELHVGTFTPEGTFRAAMGKLEHVAALGATAIELM